MTIRRRAKAPPVPTEVILPAVSWEDVLANLNDAVILVGTDGRVLSCNPAAEQLLEVPQGQICGKYFESVFAESPDFLDVLRRVHESLQPRTQTAEVVLGGQPVRVVTSTLVDRSGRSRGTVLLIHNLRYHRALQEDVDRAERLAQLGTVAAGLAHEIKNPLGGIKGAAQLLQRRLDNDPPAREYTEVIIRETDRLTGLVEQLLNLGSLRPPEFTALNIHRLISEVLLLTREAPAAKGITVRCEFDPSLPPVRGDERQLKQVLVNLVSNALQAMDGHGTLTLITRIETDFHIVSARHGMAKLIRVEVADEGSGISQENLPHIFDPFFTTKGYGTGLGLAISQRIVSEHHGSLRAEARPGGGTIFRLSLPVALE